MITYFFCKNEISNLTGNAGLSEWNCIQSLSAIFNFCGMSNIQVLIIKDKAKHVLMNYKNGKVNVASYWHLKLSNFLIKNDTGAGDAFAGGFIAGMLSKDLLIHQPLPIEIGAQAASARMECKKDPFENIKNTTESYFEQINREEHKNLKQKIRLFNLKLRKQIPVYVSGIITGIIASLIVWWIQLVLFSI